MTKTILKILSYNIHKGFNASNRAFILPQLRDALRKLDPDFVFLQEVQGKHKKRKLKKIEKQLDSSEDNKSLENLEDLDVPQTEFLAEACWPNFIYGKNAIYGPAHHGSALLSKFPFSMWDNINVSLSKRASRSLLHGVIELPETQIHVICIHLGLFTAERKLQLSVLTDRIKEHIPDDTPLIIAGDFNDWQGKVENHLETELAMKEVYKMFYGDHAKTFPAVRPAFRVDRIYYRGLGLRKTEVLGGLPWKKLSDHVPLYAELVLG